MILKLVNILSCKYVLLYSTVINKHLKVDSMKTNIMIQKIVREMIVQIMY